MKRAAALALVFATTVAPADEVKPGRVARLSLGDGPAETSCARIDRGRSGRVAKLPDEVTLAAKAVLPGTNDVSIASLGGRAIAAMSNGQLVAMDRKGHVTTLARFPVPPLFGPIVTTAGDVVVVTKSGVALAVDGAGHVRWTLALPSRDIRAAAVPMPDGGVAFSSGKLVLRVDGDGHVVARARLAEFPSFGLAVGGDAIFAVTETGKIVSWKRSEEPKIRAQLASAPAASIAVRGDLLAATEGSRLTLFDVGTFTELASLRTPTSFDGPPSIAAGTTWIATAGGVLFAIGRDGHEAARATLHAPGVRDAPQASSTPPLLADDDGRVAFVTATGEVGIATKASVKTAEARACGEPIDLAWGGDSLLVACRDGTIAWYGGGEGSAPAAPSP